MKNKMDEFDLAFYIDDKGKEKLTSIRGNDGHFIKLNKMETQLLSSLPQLINFSLGGFILLSHYCKVETLESGGRYVKYRRVENFNINKSFIEQYLDALKIVEKS